ncbi:MAG: hypothetical protein JEZ00_13535 [Anaerolineaceae bacterium]|nr:hypothetical protein [Anaerolineaceae bacterium]
MKKLFYPQIYNLIFSILFICILSSCTTVGEVDLKAWIDAPMENITYSQNEPIEVFSHAYGKAGVAEIMLYINGEPYRRDKIQGAENELVSFSQEWTPTQPGTYSIQIYAIDINGEKSLPANVVIKVAIPPTSTFTFTPTRPTETPTPTFTDTPTFTPTPTIYNPPPATYTPTTKVESADYDEPPAPVPAVPANGVNLSCRSTQTLAWLPVSDPSGIQGYYVSVEKVSGGGDWVNEGSYGPISGKQMDISVDCGIKYRWRVMAKDGAGNSGNWSGKVEFTVLLD